MVKVGVIGATGYAGIELVRLLNGHPEVQLVALTSESHAGQELSTVYPGLAGELDLVLGAHNPEAVLESCEVVFLALPHGHAAPVAAMALEQGRLVIDLGADLRLKDGETYQRWYGLEAAPREVLRQAIYGLTELARGRLAGARLVANPGCYPTASTLALAPLVKEGLVAANSVVIDAKSGVTGAGRGLSLASHYPEVSEGLHAYGVAGHRHQPEIEQTLSWLAGEEVRVTFTPHLVPMNRGILATCYASLRRELTLAELEDLYRSFYRGERFVQLLPRGRWPHTKWVYGSNHCHLGLALDEHTGRVVVMAAIDNLVKGASGQAVQNLNVLLGLPEETGLTGGGLYP